ncbi:MAG: hypothetical protein C4547_14705 [Phycisphaerales bacterium]|nr:MAG: hypothetical protein C4547_14705 [Phycisphaerales bacterium]
MGKAVVRYWLRLVIGVVPLVSPAVLMLAGGRSPVRSAAQLASDYPATTPVLDALYPDNWTALVVCSILICVPGIGCVVGADYLAEVTFWRVNLNTTPSGVWRVAGYLIALAANWLAFSRLTGAE